MNVAGDKFSIYAGTFIDGANGDNAAHLHIGYLAGASSKVYQDGTETGSGDAGTNGITAGFTIGGHHTGSSAVHWDGQISLIGIYEGDLTADGAYADFTAWVESHYGITIA